MVAEDLLIENCRLLSPRARETSLTLEGGRIAAVGDAGNAGERLDAGGRVVTPGLIDLHIQGAGGADVLDADLDAMKTISRTCASFGVTGFLATTVFRPDGDNRHMKSAARAGNQDLGGARCLGMHLEGPFISMEKRGMISPGSICQPDPQVLGKILRLSRGTLRMMTLAPELPGIGDIIAKLRHRGIIPSLGHTNASYEQTISAIQDGISHVTHLFNAMPQLHHRNPGPLLAILGSDVSAQLISDGVHVSPSVVRWAFRLMGQDRIVPITDGIRAMGLPDGSYVYDGLEFDSRNGAARYRDGTLIGTSLGMDAIVRRLDRFTGCGMATAIGCATANPARVLGLQATRGFIGLGHDADLVIWDRGYRAWATIVDGTLVHGPQPSGEGQNDHKGGPD